MTVRFAMVFVFTLFYLGACAHQRSAPFIESEYAQYEGDGSSQICGKALIKSKAGVIIPGGLPEVRLTPNTTYSTEWFTEGVVHEQRLSDADQRAKKYNRTTKADSDGKFCFHNIPAGSYYLTSAITWEAGEEQVYGRTEVKKGQTVEVKMTRYVQAGT